MKLRDFIMENELIDAKFWFADMEGGVFDIFS